MGLLENVGRLPEPRDYYSGLSAVLTALPRNVLLFSRRRAFGHARPAQHYRYVMVTCLQGSGAAILDGRLHYLDPGEGMLIFPYQAHDYAQFRNDDVVWLFVTFEFGDESCLEALRDVRYRLVGEEQAVLDKLVSAFRSGRDGREESSDDLALLLAGLLARLVRRGPQFRSSPEKPRQLSPHYELVRSAVRFVHGHIEEKFGIAEVAMAVALSESRLRAVFREMVGVPLGDYILRSRINRACSLLGGSALNVSEVAAACGFESLYSFSRAFKKRRGVAPSTYRKAGLPGGAPGK
jgi:AraC-like DNA-binding protein